MTARTNTVTLAVHVAWWVWPYLNTLSFMCTLTGLEPDMDKVRLTVFKGLKVSIVR